MNKEDAENLLDSIFPIGEERWIKVRYIDREKVLKAFRLSPGDENQRKKFIDKFGYEVTAIGVQPEYEPQAYFILELQKIINDTVHNLSDYDRNFLNDLFNMKLDELLSKSVKYPNINYDGHII